MSRGVSLSPDIGAVSRERPSLTIAEQRLTADLRQLGHFYLHFHDPLYQQATCRVDSYGEVGGTIVFLGQNGDYNDPDSYTIKQYEPDAFRDHHPNPQHAIHTWVVDKIQLHQEELTYERLLFLQSAVHDEMTAKLTLRAQGNEWQSPTESGRLDCARMVAARAMYHFQKQYKLTADELLQKIRADHP